MKVNINQIKPIKVDISSVANNIKAQTGNSGQPGLSAYAIWLKNGNTGTEQDFLDSLIGEDGVQGPQGVPGPQGPQGETGDSVDLSSFAEGMYLEVAIINGEKVLIGITKAELKETLEINLIDNTIITTINTIESELKVNELVQKDYIDIFNPKGV